MLMLVAFIGQAMASTTMSCEHESSTANMSEMKHEAMLDSTMNHSDMMSVNDDSNNMMDCCQEQCKCPMNGCFSLSLLVNTHFNSLGIAEQKIPQLSSVHQSQINTSLYRPPIS